MFMVVPMSMRLARRITRPMYMLMMLVVNVRVLVFHWFVPMFMFVPFSGM